MTDNIQIRRSAVVDIPYILDIFAYARHFMATNGNPCQWVNGNPDKNFLLNDINMGSSYVCTVNDKIVGTFVLQEGKDPTYNVIHDGQWLNEEPYATIHRIAGNGETKGLLHAALQFALQTHSNIRIDTHRDNTVMQNALRKEGFIYCGIINCWNGGERMAYQLVRSKLMKTDLA